MANYETSHYVILSTSLLLIDVNLCSFYILIRS
jgi:hypothetical protein